MVNEKNDEISTRLQFSLYLAINTMYLKWILSIHALFGASRVLAERPGGRRAIDEFMQGAGAGLAHRPDAVICGLDGLGSFTLIDLKTFDTCAPTHIHGDHSDRRRLGTHAAVASRCARHEYGVLLPRMRLVVLAVSIHGSFSGPSLRFLADLGRRAGGGVPVTLLDCASWAVPRFAPFIRMAVAHAVRRGLAEAVLRRWRRVRDPSDLPSGLGVPLAAPPALALAGLPPPGLPAPAPVHAGGPDPHAAVALGLFGGG